VTDTSTGTAPPSNPRPATRGRARYWIAAVLCTAAVGALLFGVLGSNIQYYRTVSEATKKKGIDTFRMAGLVVPSTVCELKTGVRFYLTDGTATAVVIHTGAEPGLFANAEKEHKPIPIVVQGKWSANKSVFDSNLIMIKHGNDYNVPSVTTTTLSAAEIAVADHC
jgi:cytochrome c-type biogenesis protein CcmE